MTNPAGASGASSGSSGGSGSSGSSNSGTSGSGSTDSGGSDAASGGKLGLLVDNMTTMRPGTRTQLVVPSGQTPGSYYTYSDPASNYNGTMTLVEGTADLGDVPISPAIMNPDGSQIVGELCFNGRATKFAGLGMSLAYGNPPDASPESGISTPVPFDASHYRGVSFYIFVQASDAGAQPPTIHFSIPDTQTADPAAWPPALCDVDGGVCDDDFGSDVSFTGGVWTKVSFAWTDLSTVGYGMPTFSAIKQNQLIGMKWQVNGNGIDASEDPFNFCISDIYFTP